MEKLLCVYCASGLELDAKYYAAGAALGRGLAERGWGLVYGGGKAGVMGSVALATKAANPFNTFRATSPTTRKTH
jgi:predicted Rossmann-fold nucleotide-binding protein